MDAIKKGKTESIIQLIEFFVMNDKPHYFGIDIEKAREIIKISKVVKIPDSHMAVLGTTQLRGNVITIIHLPYYLGFRNDRNYDTKKNKIIITNIDGKLYGFLVDDITRIYRVNKSEIEDYTSVSDLKLARNIIGVVKIGDHLVQLLDFERILRDVI